jgi:mannose-6-phosphate isomerase-like protein (cupin superfamily)
MRIAMLSPMAGRTHPGLGEPAQRMIGLLTGGLAARGIDVTLFPSARGETAAPLAPVPPQSSLDEAKLADVEASESFLMSELFDRADDFDLIHNHAGFLPLTYSGLVKRPILTTIHGCSSGSSLPIYRKYNGRTYYVSVSQASRWPELTYQATIYYGIDVDSFSLRDGGAAYLLFYGPISPETGVTEAIRISQLADKALVIGGAIHNEAYFADEITPLLDGKRIRYVGPVRPEMRNELFGEASALLHPVACGGPFDLSVLEAAACGTPVVAFFRGILPEIISDGINGFLVPDVMAAAEAVNRIPTVSRPLCRRIAAERFSMSHMVDEYVKVYEGILEKTKTEDRRPWGYYVVLSDLPDHKVKRIVVWPGKRLSLQRHRFRSEHWTIIAGSPVVTIGGKEVSLQVGQSIDIPVRTEHRIFNPGQDPVVFIEVQMGEYFGEDDIERFEDDFGRL